VNDRLLMPKKRIFDVLKSIHFSMDCYPAVPMENLKQAVSMASHIASPPSKKIFRRSYSCAVPESNKKLRINAMLTQGMERNDPPPATGTAVK
jgi:hypothetical protein